MLTSWDPNWRSWILSKMQQSISKSYSDGLTANGRNKAAAKRIWMMMPRPWTLPRPGAMKRLRHHWGKGIPGSAPCSTSGPMRAILHLARQCRRVEWYSLILFQILHLGHRHRWLTRLKLPIWTKINLLMSVGWSGIHLRNLDPWTVDLWTSPCASGHKTCPGVDLRAAFGSGIQAITYVTSLIKTSVSR